MKSRLVISFKNSLMGPSSGLNYRVTVNNVSIDQSTVKDTNSPLVYEFEEISSGRVVIFNSEGVNVEINRGNSYQIKIGVIDINSNIEKEVGVETLNTGKQLTMVIVSPWTKISIQNIGRDDFSGGFYNVEYKINKTGEIRELKIAIKDIPRKIITTALKYRGDIKWAGTTSVASRHPELGDEVTFGSGTNKCNIFVNDVLTESGVKVAWIEHGKSTNIPFYKRLSPPTAGEWANSSKLLNSWSVENTPEPGDVGAYSYNYSDASGPVGIIIADGVTISAGWNKIELNDCGFRVKYNTASEPSQEHDFTIFRRYKGMLR